MLTRDTNKPIVNQVTMIQSKFQKYDSNFLGRKVHLPAAVFNKSPTRLMTGNFASPNRLGTPSRLQGKVTSPMRFRKHQPSNRLNNYFSQPSPMLGSNQNQIKSRGLPLLSSGGNYCTNTSHGLKPGTFIVQNEQGSDIYCQKCAILLASKGFKVQKMQKSMAIPQPPQLSKLQYLCELDNPQRRSSLMTFLNELQKINTQLIQRKNEAQSVLKTNGNYFKQQEQNIQLYFEELKQTIDNQKLQILQQVKALKRQSERIPDEQLKKIMTCINDCESMKEDVYESIEIIKQVDDQAFDQVITAYLQKAQQIKTMNLYVNDITNQPKIVGDNVHQIGRKIVGMLNFRIQTEDNQKNAYLEIEQQQLNPLKDRQSSVYFSFDNSSKQPMATSTEPAIDLNQQQPIQEANPKQSMSLKLNSNLNYQYGQF